MGAWPTTENSRADCDERVVAQPGGRLGVAGRSRARSRLRARVRGGPLQLVGGLLHVLQRRRAAVARVAQGLPQLARRLGSVSTIAAASSLTENATQESGPA